MTNPIGDAVAAYDRALAGQRGDLHLHLAPDFADAFIDRGEGHDPLTVGSIVGRDEDDRLRALSVDAYTRAPRGEELRIGTDLGSLHHVTHTLYTVTGTAHDRFHERVLQFTRFRRAQNRLRRAASFYGVAMVVALASMAALPLAFERDASDLVGVGLLATTFALPWLGLLLAVVHFRALGVTQGMGALAKRPGDPFFQAVSTRSTHGRRTVRAWLTWAGAYVLVMGTALTIAVFLLFSEDTSGAFARDEAMSGAAIAVAMLFASTLLALGFTYLVALMIGTFAMTMVDGHDTLFESRHQRAAARYVTAFLPATLVWVVLNAIVFPSVGESSRHPVTVITNVIDGWRAGPIDGTHGALVIGHWLSVAVMFALLATGIVLGLRDRIARRPVEEPEPPRTYPHPWTT